MTKLTRNTDQLFTEVAEHVAQDRITQGTYGTLTENGFRGCFIGCLGYSQSNVSDCFSEANAMRRVIERFNFTEPLLRIAENIFETLPANEAQQFFADFPAAVGTDGKDLSRVHWQFLAAELRALPPMLTDVQAVIDPVIAGMDLLANGQEWPEDEADEAARAAGAAAARAARAVTGADEAARAARAARGWAGGWAGATIRKRDLFLELVRNAPVITSELETQP